MIEPSEQELLFDLAGFAELSPTDIVCEFGSYLGRSTRCLADGLLQNTRLRLDGLRPPVLHAFDVFACAESGAFADYLLRDTRQAHVENLLKIDDGRIDFLGVFDHFMRDVPARLLTRHQTDLASARHPGGTIALMHVDAPKWYTEYRQMLGEFGAHLRPGSQIVLQDYFYQWSAELIAAVQLSIEDGHFIPQETAASSLLVRAVRPMNASILASMDARLQPVNVTALITRAIDFFSGFEVDRPEQFVSRLYLAAMQHCFEMGDHAQSSHWLQKLQRRCRGSLPPPVVADLSDLARYGFSLRRLYARDVEDSKGAVGASTTLHGTADDQT